jgi:hypothetical protein
MGGSSPDLEEVKGGGGGINTLWHMYV